MDIFPPPLGPRLANKQCDLGNSSKDCYDTTLNSTIASALSFPLM